MRSSSSLLRPFAILVLMALTHLVSAQNIFRDQDPVPPDFGKEKTTVLVYRTEQKKVNTALEETFAKYYGGKYKLIDEKDLDEFADVPAYRYCFRTSIQFVDVHYVGSTRMPAENRYTYDILDRATGDKHGLDFQGAAYKGLMKKYVQKMEEVRQANGGN